ncbi:MAG: hypothetical protein AAF436_17115 [Myxococcota bacterium]
MGPRPFLLATAAMLTMFAWSGSAFAEFVSPECEASIHRAAGDYSQCLLEAEAQYALHWDSDQLDDERAECLVAFESNAFDALEEFGEDRCPPDQLLTEIELLTMSFVEAVSRFASGEPESCGEDSSEVIKTVFIIRHGEKQSTFGCLDKKGWRRAFGLIDVFAGDAPLANDPPFPSPEAIFANRYTNPLDCQRCFQTARPLAFSLPGVFIDKRYGWSTQGGNPAAAAAILQRLEKKDPILVVWEHTNIRRLTIALGVPRWRVPFWSSTDFDSVYILRYCGDELISFRRSMEGLNHPEYE